MTAQQIFLNRAIEDRDNSRRELKALKEELSLAKEAYSKMAEMALAADRNFIAERGDRTALKASVRAALEPVMSDRWLMDEIMGQLSGDEITAIEALYESCK